MNVSEKILSLCEFPGPSGYETDVVEFWSQQISEYDCCIHTTTLNNAVAEKHGGQHKIMIVAHADEIGLIIKYIDNEGFLYFDCIGGVDPSLLPGKEIEINTSKGPLIGVIGSKPIHLKERGQECKSLDIEDLWIDIQCKSRKEAEDIVQIGDTATFRPTLHRNGKCIIGKSMDDRCGLAIMLEVADRLKQNKKLPTLYFVASTQEELRGRGAKTAAWELEPDICIVIDVTHATDYPTMSPIKDGDIKLGKGCVVTVGPNIDPNLSHELIEIARAKEISFQIEACGRPTGTDANEIQIVGKGIKTCLISIPCRYMHSPIEIIHEDDVNSAIELLVNFIESREN